MARSRGTVLLVSACLVGILIANPISARAGTGLCKSIPPAGQLLLDLNNASLHSTVGETTVAYLKDPFKGMTKPTFCWLTPSQVAANTKCESVRAVDPSVASFAAGYCVSPGENGEAVVLPQGFADSTGASTHPGTYVFVRYEPKDTASTTAVLQAEWEEGHSHHTKDFVVTGTPPITGADERYRISLFAGVAYLFSQDNFGKAFPELRALVETRFLDGYENCKASHPDSKYCDQVPTSKTDDSAQHGPLGFQFFDLRLYGDIGLTSTSATQSSPSSSSGGSQGSTTTNSSDGSTTQFQGSKAFCSAPHFG